LVFLRQVPLGGAAQLHVLGERTLAFACRHRKQAVVTCFLSFEEPRDVVCDRSGTTEEAAVVSEAVDCA